MEQLWPDPGPEAAADLYADLSERSSWFGVDFVMSLDGAVTVAGRSGPLGGEGDKAVFMRLRDRADAVVVGAGTVRIEDYGPPKSRAVSERLTWGQQPRPRLVVVTRSGDLLDLARLWSDPDWPPTIVIGTDAPQPRLQALRQRGAELIVVGDDGPDLVAAIRVLREDGYSRLLSEGGPSLTTDLLAAGLITDLFVTVSPVLVGGAFGMVPDILPTPMSLALAAVRHHEGELFLHHRVTAEATPVDR